MADDPRAIVREAFLAARRSGKGDWNRMTVAVLKNRLLHLSGGQFDEHAYGAKTFLDFVRKLEDVLSVDTNTWPPTVQLLGDAPEVIENLRRDLWTAIVDYRSGRRYVWDPTQLLAREASPDETSNILPTLSAEEFAQWRRKFAEQHQGEIGGEDARLLRWAERGLPTKLLPVALQGPWIQEVKKKVEERIRGWFNSQGFALPAGLLVAKQSTTKVRDDELAALRELVIECVRQMTRDELSEIKLPPAAILRGREKRFRGRE